MRVMVLGASGMLGHKLVQVLARDFDVIATCRSSSLPFPAGVQVIDGIDVIDGALLDFCISAVSPAAVLNAIGIVKQTMDETDRARIIEINALLPNRLAVTCAKVGARLIHFSTDSVFSGDPHSIRGANGYREVDPADAHDLYGLSKLLGEPTGARCLTLRTSIVGPELRARRGLLEWFLAEGDTTIRGFTKALFTGLPTVILAELVGEILRDQPHLEDTWTRLASMTCYGCSRRLGTLPPGSIPIRSSFAIGGSTARGLTQKPADTLPRGRNWSRGCIETPLVRVFLIQGPRTLRDKRTACATAPEGSLSAADIRSPL